MSNGHARTKQCSRFLTISNVLKIVFSRFSTYVLGLSAYILGRAKKTHTSWVPRIRAKTVSKSPKMLNFGLLVGFSGGLLMWYKCVMNHLQPWVYDSQGMPPAGDELCGSPQLRLVKIASLMSKIQHNPTYLFGPVGLKRTFYGGVPHLLSLLWLHLRCGYGSDLKITSNGLSGPSGLCSIY